MRANKHRVRLPIGRTAKLAYQIEALRNECCLAAEKLVQQRPLNEAELDECARLDDTLAAAHRLLKVNLKRITLARLKRRSQTK